MRSYKTDLEWHFKYQCKRNTSAIFGKNPKARKRPRCYDWCQCCLTLDDLDLAEHKAAGLAERTKTAVEDDEAALPPGDAIHLADAHARGDEPHVLVGNVGEQAAELDGDTDASKESEDLVAEVFAQVEARVRQLPDAVDGADTLGLSQDILKLRLENNNNIWL